MKSPADLPSFVDAFAPEPLTLGRPEEEQAYVLDGLLRCGACGGTWEPGLRGPRRVPSYGCGDPECAAQPVLRATLERAVEEALAKELGDAARFEQVEQGLRRRLARGSRADLLSPADAPWMLGLVQDFRFLWRHVVPQSQRKMLRVFVDHLLVTRENVFIAWAIDGLAGRLE